MAETLRELGHVKLVQVQPSGLIIETPSGYFYDASRLLEVDRLHITSLGVEATTREGEHVLDIHHISHPDKAYDNDDLVCIGFTSHYEAMRARFGEHMVDGIAGENIKLGSAMRDFADLARKRPGLVILVRIEPILQFTVPGGCVKCFNQVSRVIDGTLYGARLYIAPLLDDGLGQR